MSDDSNSTAANENQGPFPAVSNLYSNQPTTLVETTLAETLGLSMHNAVTSQQSSQMTTSASITNACARLLQASNRPQPKEKPGPQDDSADADGPMVAEQRETPPPKRKFNIMNFIRKKKKNEENSEAATTAKPEQNNDAESKGEAPPEENKS